VCVAPVQFDRYQFNTACSRIEQCQLSSSVVQSVSNVRDPFV